MSWHLSKAVPITLFVSMFAVIGSFSRWGSNIETRMDIHEKTVEVVPVLRTDIKVLGAEVKNLSSAQTALAREHEHDIDVIRKDIKEGFREVNKDIKDGFRDLNKRLDRSQ